jgi:hypothetical protein
MELAASSSSGLQITSWSIPSSAIDTPFYFGGTLTGTNMAKTTLTPIDPTKITTIALQLYPGISCADGGTCSVGNVGPGGGTVFYAAATPFLNQATGQYVKYLEVAPAGSLPSNPSQPTSAGVDPKYQVCSSSAGPPYGWGYGAQYKLMDGIGYGAYNSNFIYNNYSLCNSSGLALAVVKAYRGGGYSDWFLPSVLEERALYTYTAANSYSGWTNGYYWTSSNFDSSNTGMSQYSVGAMYGVAMGVAGGTNQITNAAAYEPIRVIRAF